VGDSALIGFDWFSRTARRLPPQFLEWFAERGWSPRAHQLDLLAARRREIGAADRADRRGQDAGRLPALADRTRRAAEARPGEAYRGIHTLYISPLKALAVDIERNLGKPVEEMALPISIETRTGDTPTHKRQRQKLVPPDILLTTPEQLALLLASADAKRFFEDLRYVVLDELHSLVTSKRGHLLALGLARLRRFVPDLQTIGLSATVAEPDELRRWLVAAEPARRHGLAHNRDLITVAGGAKPHHHHPRFRERVPWAGHSARYAIPEVYEAIAGTGRRCSSSTRAARRSCCSRSSGASTRIRCRSRCITARSTSAQRRRVEKAMEDEQPARHRRHLDARSRHRLGRCRSRRPCRRAEGREPARPAHRPLQPPHGRAVEGAILVPANRFEVLECRAALEANYLGAQDTPPLVDGALDVLAQHVLGSACAEAFDADVLFERGPLGRALCRRSTARPSTASSISSPPAATRSKPTSAMPASARRRRAVARLHPRSPSSTG
jgi:ATP-dependent Lhr-like helicase